MSELCEKGHGYLNTDGKCASCERKIDMSEEMKNEKFEFEAFRKWMFDNCISASKSGGQVLSLINSGTGKMLFKVWKGARQSNPPTGMNHYCQGESGNGEWSCRSEVGPSLCHYCKKPNEALTKSMSHSTV